MRPEQGCGRCSRARADKASSGQRDSDVVAGSAVVSAAVWPVWSPRRLEWRRGENIYCFLHLTRPLCGPYPVGNLVDGLPSLARCVLARASSHENNNTYNKGASFMKFYRTDIGDPLMVEPSRPHRRYSWQRRCRGAQEHVRRAA
eukprot:COSAG06_NODE_3265_length_5594_cov_4.359054_2_plen_145_part_00